MAIQHEYPTLLPKQEQINIAIRYSRTSEYKALLCPGVLLSMAKRRQMNWNKSSGKWMAVNLHKTESLALNKMQGEPLTPLASNLLTFG